MGEGNEDDGVRAFAEQVVECWKDALPDGENPNPNTAQKYAKLVVDAMKATDQNTFAEDRQMTEEEIQQAAMGMAIEMVRNDTDFCRRIIQAVPSQVLVEQAAYHIQNSSDDDDEDEIIEEVNSEDDPSFSDNGSEYSPARYEPI